MKKVIVSGLSGSGKSLAYKTFEDLGYYCVDNIPVEMLGDLFRFTQKYPKRYQDIALIVDARDGASVSKLPAQMQKLLDQNTEVELLFLDAKDHVLIQRYSETRHRHPLSQRGTIEDGIAKERELLAPVRDIATHYVDTSDFTSKDLRQHLLKKFGQPKLGAKSVSMTVMSFGFKYGIPLNSDLMFDVRFIRNPFFQKELQSKTGLDQGVQDYVLSQDPTKKFLKHVENLLTFLVPLYEKEGKNYLQISIGCTGGQHRSVVISEILGQTLEAQGYDVSIVHREQG